MNLLCIVPTLDLNSTFGAAPYLNQFLSALKTKVKLEVFESKSYRPSIVERAYHRFIMPNTPYSYAKILLKRYSSFSPDAILIIHDFRWLAKPNTMFLKKKFQCKLFFYDLESPLDFPEHATDKRYGGSSPWLKMDVSNMDGTIIPSKGASEYFCQKLHAQKIHVMYFSIDPSWYPNERLEEKYDVSYLGFSTFYREESITNMVSIPSRKLQNLRFIVSSFNAFDFGNAEVIPSLRYNTFTSVPRQSKINLSITRIPFTDIYASSVSRPFELGAMKCCTVSNPCLGIEEWFQPRKEILIVKDSESAIETYQWLLENPNLRKEFGEKIYERVIKEHNTSCRAENLVKFLENA
jgi:spore maturation protein CgeB